MHQTLSKSNSKILNVLSLVFVCVSLGILIFNVNLETYSVSKIQSETIEVSQNLEVLELENPKLDLKLNDKVIVESAGEYNYISELYKLPQLKLIILLFCVFIIYILKMQGFRVISSLISSILVIAYFCLPLISMGYSPIWACFASSLILVPLTFYLSHGYNKKTNLAVASTVLTLLASSLIIYISMRYLNLSGMSSEEANFLMFNADFDLDFKGILFGGILISLLGILDDITISQTSLTLEIYETNPAQSFKKLFIRSIKVGKDHIASLTNTIFLIYAGASLPLLILFHINAEQVARILNNETFIEEIIRSIIGSTSLILAVFISSFLACFFRKNN